MEVWKSEDGGEAKMVLELGPGGAFGELALIYNQPRAASGIEERERGLKGEGGSFPFDDSHTHSLSPLLLVVLRWQGHDDK